MKIEIKVDEKCREPKILIVTDKITEEINDLVRRMSKETLQVLIGYFDDAAEPLPYEGIVHAYASAGKVYAITEQKKYVVRLRLYELENKLDRKTFIRISQSEIINLKKVQRFDLSFTGTIGISLSDGTTVYASRRYVKKIKQVLECEVIYMKKKAFIRGLQGVPQGIAIGLGMTIIMSLIINDGRYHAVVPGFIEIIGNEINAVIVQVLMSGLLGAVFGSSSVIWDIEDWSIPKQSGVYFLTVSLAMLPIAYYLQWMEHDFMGFVKYFSVYFSAFAIMWGAMFIGWRRKIQKLNQEVRKKKKEK